LSSGIARYGDPLSNLAIAVEVLSAGGACTPCLHGTHVDLRWFDRDDFVEVNEARDAGLRDRGVSGTHR
jgi:hypothetical protein